MQMCFAMHTSKDQSVSRRCTHGAVAQGRKINGRTNEFLVREQPRQKFRVVDPPMKVYGMLTLIGRRQGVAYLVSDEIPTDRRLLLKPAIAEGIMDPAAIMPGNEHICVT